MNGFQLIWKGGTVEAFKKFLKDNPALPQGDRNNLLGLAVEKNRVDLLPLLVEAGAGVNFVTNSQRSPLRLAAEAGHKEAALWLLDHGADIHYQADAYSSTPLHDAISSGDLNLVKLLLSCGADPERLGQNPQKNALATAEFFSQAEVAAYLKSIGLKSIMIDPLKKKKIDVESPEFMKKSLKDPFKWFEKKWMPVFEHVNSKGLKKLGEKNRILFLVGYMIDQLAGEGASGFYSNPSGAHALQLPAALDKIGAADYARLLERINALFPKGKPATDDDTRAAQMKKLPLEAETLGAELERLFKANKPLLKKLYDFYHA